MHASSYDKYEVIKRRAVLIAPGLLVPVTGVAYLRCSVYRGVVLLFLVLSTGRLFFQTF